MNLHAFSVLCFSYGALLVAILALIKRRDQVGFYFFVFSLVVCSWSFLFSLWITQNYSEEKTMFLIRTSYLFVMFIPILWFRFLFNFLDKSEPFPYFYKINYAIAFLLALTCYSDLMFVGTHSLLNFKYLPTPGITHHIHMIIFATYVPFGFYHLMKKILQVSGYKRIQLLFLFLGTFSGFLAGTANYLSFYRIPVPLSLHLLMPLYPLLVGIALIQYGLFDLEEMAATFRRDKLAALGVLSASINHEIKNPLFVIQGLGESHLSKAEEGFYSDKGNHAAKADDVIRKVINQAERAMDIMKRFSLFAKRGIDETTDIQPVYMQETIKNILPLIRYELEVEKVELLNLIADDAPPLYVDPRHLEEILFNLVINASQAIKSTGKRGAIEISSKMMMKEMAIIIKDNGPGITADQRKHIFTPFYTSKESGTGLGLYITKQLVERNKGKIVLDEASNETVFKITFPLATADRGAVVNN